MTADEADMWWRYGAKHGLDPLTPRNDIVLANVAHLFCVANGIKSKVTNEPFDAAHFLQWLEVEEEPISLESAMRTWN
jgi:hypothetical protein